MLSGWHQKSRKEVVGKQRLHTEALATQAFDPSLCPANLRMPRVWSLVINGVMPRSPR